MTRFLYSSLITRFMYSSLMTRFMYPSFMTRFMYPSLMMMTSGSIPTEGASFNLNVNQDTWLHIDLGRKDGLGGK